MGWGNYVILSTPERSQCDAESVKDEDPAAQTTQLRSTTIQGDIVVPIIVGVDCRGENICDSCFKNQCPGCGEQIIEDRRQCKHEDDEPRRICVSCAGVVDIWHYLAALYLTAKNLMATTAPS